MNRGTNLEASEHVRRARSAPWMRLLDARGSLRTMGGWARLWTALTRSEEVHQTNTMTAENRYPELFDGVARLVPDAQRVLSFGCSTGQELESLRQRFPTAEIVGAEINAHSRKLAKRRTAADPRTHVVGPDGIDGSFDAVFALAVLQRNRRVVNELGIDDLSDRYPYSKFDKTVSELVGRLRPGGVLCVTLAHYPIEVSSSANFLDPVSDSPLMEPPLFGADGHRLNNSGLGRSIFIKRA